MRAQGRNWIIAIAAGCAAVGWLWAALRFSAGLAELASRMPSMIFGAVVALIFVLGAVPGFFALRDERVRLPRERNEERSGEREEEHDTLPTMPAPAASTRAPSSTRPEAPVPQDDKEYF